MTTEDALHYLRSQLTINTQCEDLKEGIAAFMEKRAPQWKGRLIQGHKAQGPGGKERSSVSRLRPDAVHRACGAAYGRRRRSPRPGRGRCHGKYP